MKARGAARGPLRLIVGGYVNGAGVVVEVLACGHDLHRREDIAGPTNAARRRCWKCAKGLPVDRDPGKEAGPP